MVRRLALLLVVSLCLTGPSLAASTDGHRPGAEPPSPAEPKTRVTVDRRIELVGIIFRLAGHPEYNRCMVRAYADAVDAHFADHKGHDVVKLARLLRSQRGVSYDAPMSLAVHMDPATFAPAMDLDPRPAGVDGRWPPEDARRFCELAADFARAASFDAFMKAHAERHRRAASRLQRIVDRHLDLAWFDRYFGHTDPVELRIVVGLQNGPNNYGSRVITGPKRTCYSIIGAWKLDRDGEPVYSSGFTGTIVHEFCHSYANRLIDEHADELEAAGTSLFRPVAEQMKAQAYGNWRTMMYEYLVRACQVRYAAEHAGPLAATGSAMRQARRGFVHIGGLCQLLIAYESDRETYPTLDDFMPRIVEFFDERAAQLTNAESAD